MSRPPNGYGSAPPSAMNSNTRLASPQVNQRPHTPGSAPAMSRAERFEDEKRRIIESCFSKLDQAGQLAESYITHIRIQEDAQHPSNPPPPDSPAENKKPRVIIIAVRSTGRVRMHKARENNNGSFSIGKTWNLEELSAIETYASTTLHPQNDKDAQYKAWAGTTGFTVTITKPYYWQAGTSKEKDFFIASAIKIFRKYTKGQVPELKGFDEREKAMILGAAPSAQTPGARAESEIHRSPAPPQPPFAQREQSREESRYRSPGPPGGSGPNSRMPSESPARFAQAQPLAAPPVLRNKQERSQSRDGIPPELRPGPPGASAGRKLSQPPNQRIPQPQVAQPAMAQQPIAQQPIAQQPPRTPLRAESSSAPPVSVAREQIPAALKPQSPPRIRNKPSIDGIVSEQQDAFKPQTNGADSGGSLLNQSKRQRWGLQPTSPPNGQPVIPISPVSPVSPPQLPPLETTPPKQNKTNRYGADMSLKSGSSLGLDLGEAAGVGALGSIWSETQNKASPVTNEPSSPQTPERSRKRPPLEQSASASTLDLRPAPLNHSRKPPEESARQVRPQETSPKANEFLQGKQPSVQSQSDTALLQPAPVASSKLQPSPEPTPEPTPVAEKTADDVQEEEQFRPGLGPMFKKKAIADRFKKAATAANAFKPRPGGAAEKILRDKAERERGPDGITGVVPRPQPRPEPKEETLAATDGNLAVKDPPKQKTPIVAVDSPTSPQRRDTTGQRGVELKDDTAHLHPSQRSREPDTEDKLEQRQVRQPQVRIKRRSVQQEKYLAALEIDRSLVEGRGLEFEMMLADFGWSDTILQPKQLNDLENDIKREHGRVETGSWLSHTDAAREERVAHVEHLLDKAITECDELEGLLTLYHVELSSLNDDIAFIEAQSQGLQVQSANQKLLQTELQNLVDTMSLDRRMLEPLRYGDFSDANSLDEIEQSLVRLYQAMITIDPSARSNAHGRPRSHGGFGEHETSNMAALREKKTVYDRESAEFCQRLMQFLDNRFTISMNSAKGRVLRVSGGPGLARLQPEAFSEVRNGLWMYSPLLLFMKELKPPAWNTVLRLYHQRASPLYLDAFKENIHNWKRAARAPTTEDAEVLFTTQEKEDGPTGALSSARKMTVKRSQTLAKTLRNVSGDKHGSESRQAGAMLRSAAFAGAMDEMAPLISREQNFVVDLFHATSLETADFIDAVNAAAPQSRRGTNLLERKPTEPNREMAGRVTNTMNEIFGFFLNELLSMLDWSAAEDPLQGVGVMASLSRHGYYLQETSQEFLLQVVESLSARLQTRFSKFVEEQIRAIEDTKVKIKKRKGVISFMKVFPHFSAAVENIFSAVAGNDYEGPSDCVIDVRRLIDDAYERINRAMFDSLKVIAKESPGAGIPSSQPSRGGDDPEDKEMLNYHILLIENMNHYIEEVDDSGKEGVLAEWRGRALLERAEALDAYVARVIRRPLGKLLDFLESAESILATNPANPAAVAGRPSYSRKAMRVVLSQHDGKEVRRGIETLRKRIEKHFGDADEEAISRSLVGFVCKECERSYERVLERTEKLVRDVYPPVEGEKPVEIEFARADLQAGFRR